MRCLESWFPVSDARHTWKHCAHRHVENNSNFDERQEICVVNLEALCFQKESGFGNSAQCFSSTIQLMAISSNHRQPHAASMTRKTPEPIKTGLYFEVFNLLLFLWVARVNHSKRGFPVLKKKIAGFQMEGQPSVTARPDKRKKDKHFDRQGRQVFEYSMVCLQEMQAWRDKQNLSGGSYCQSQIHPGTTRLSHA